MAFRPVPVKAMRHPNRKNPHIRLSSGNATLTLDAVEASGFKDGQLLMLEQDDENECLFLLRPITQGECSNVNAVRNGTELRLNGLKPILRNLGFSGTVTTPCTPTKGRIEFDATALKEVAVG